MLIFDGHSRSAARCSTSNACTRDWAMRVADLFALFRVCYENAESLRRGTLY